MKEKEKTSEEVHQEQLRYIKTLEEQVGTDNDDDTEEEFDGLIVADELEAEWISLEAQRQNIPPVKCKHCNFSTKSATKMVGHMTRHKKSKCDKCQKQFEDQAKLNMHIKQEHRPDLIRCNQCNKVFNTKVDLSVHIQTDHKHEKFTCNTCQKTFTANNALKQHMNSRHPTNSPVGHSQWANERNQANLSDYSCTMCNFVCETLQQLKNHKGQVHIGQSFEGFKTVTRRQHKQHSESTERCTRGQECRFLAWGSCHFFHPGVGVQKRRTNLNRQQPIEQQNGEQQHNKQQHHVQNQNWQQQSKMCHFQERCWNQNCQFQHMDFTMRQEFQENY